MLDATNRWTLILAAGSGTRLSRLTMDGRGGAVPKQFCSLNGGSSLLEETFNRAYAFSARRHTLVVVAEEHRRFWSTALESVPEENIIVQPKNRGTANGILLGLSAIRQRDPEALVSILPSDHYIAREDVLRRSVSLALMLAESGSGADAIHFLGIHPELADPELGYIVRGAPLIDGSFEIASFVEKPSRDAAKTLLRAGALWNSFILVARAGALIELIAQRYPAEVAAFDSLWRRVERGLVSSKPALEQLYATLPDIDFSRGVVEGAQARLRVVPVPYCGWSDLGTPERVANCLERFETQPKSAPSRHFNLAEAYARLASSMAVAEQSA